MARGLREQEKEDAIQDPITTSSMVTCGALIMVAGRTFHFRTDLNRMISGDGVNIIFAKVETDSKLERRVPPPR